MTNSVTQYTLYSLENKLKASQGLITRLRRREGESLSGNPAPLSEAATWINTNRELWAMRVQMPETRLASGAPEPVPERTPIRDRRSETEQKSRRPRPTGPRREN